MTVPKFAGNLVKFCDGVSYIVPALSLRQVAALRPRLAGLTGERTAERDELVLDTLHAALSRNYPDISRDDLSDVVDLRNMAALMNDVMGTSGLVPNGEEPESGEAPAVIGLGLN